MTRRDTLLERLEQVNPVPDPSVLAEDLDVWRAALHEQRRDDMMSDSSLDRFTPRSEKAPIRRGPLIGLVAAAAVILIGVVTLVTPREEGLIPGEPAGALDAYVEAFQKGDADTASALVEEDMIDGFTAWMVGTGHTGVVFEDCSVNEHERVSCRTTFGPDDFSSLLLGDQAESTFWAGFSDGMLTDISWQAPPGFQTAHAEFRTWLETTYPERYDEMYDGESILYTEASGAARRDLVDEFLAFRDG